MNDEPKAGQGLDPELLAAYIDHRLSPEQRAAVEAQLASDPDAYALLVETMKAEDALNRVHELRTVSSVPKGAVTRVRWPLYGGLAAAAVMAFALWNQAAILDLLRGRENASFARLIAAAGDERTIEGRLSGDFPYAALRPVTRGSAEENLELLALAGELQRQARTDPDPANLHAAGVALLLAGRTDEAITALRTIASGSPDARYHSDLSAALAARASRTGSAEDWAGALSEAETALAGEPDSPQALFNRALALERMFLRSQALQAWQDYLRRDPNSGWASEARNRLQDKPLSWEEHRRQLDQSPADALFDRLTVENPQLLREWVEEVVLRSWATSLASNQPEDGARALALASRIAPRISKAQADRSLEETTLAMRSSRDPIALARAWLDFSEARERYLRGEFSASGELYRKALEPLARAGSPYADTCRLYVALLPYFQGQLAAAASNLRRLAVDRPSMAGLAEARRRWMLGIIAVGQGQYQTAVSEYASALSIFEALNESEGIAGVHSALGEVRRDLGDAAWWHHARRSTELTPLVRIGRRHAILIAGTQASLSAGYPLVARQYQEETLLNATAGGTASMMSESFQWMHTVLHRLGDVDAARHTIARAREWIDAIPDAGIRERQSAELLALEAESALATDALSGSTLASAAIQKFTAEGRSRRLPQLYLNLAKAESQLGKAAAAEEAVDRGLAVVEQQRGNLRESRLRVSYFDEKWSLVELGVRLRLDRDDRAAESLAFVDRWRRPALLTVPFSAVEESTKASTQLPPGTAIVAYAALPERLVIWVMHGAGVQRTSVAVHRETIDNLVARLKLHITNRSRDAAGEHLAELSRVLLAPVHEILTGFHTIAILPDGSIGEVPFSALPWPGSDERVVDRAAVLFVPSIGDFAGGSHREERSIDGPAVIAAASRAVSEDLPELPGAIDEAQAVATVYGNQAVLRIDDLTPEDFVDLAPRAAVIHLASHASANPTLPHLSQLFLSSSPTTSSGVLTAAQVSALRLRAGLVVLAACETASGAVTRSEGVIGLASAFLNAGAGSVVASIWAADDRQSAPFQAHFHRAFQQTRNVPRALRETQLWARSRSDESSTPYAWASWVVTQRYQQ